MKDVLRTIIVDDELDSVQLLQLHLEKYCPQIQVLGAFNDPVFALSNIVLQKPDLLMLDIEMPEMNGFQLLEKLMPFRFNVIFITAYNQYAIKAFKYNALDYLLKPVSSTDLVNAVGKLNSSFMPDISQLQQMQYQLKGGNINKIAVSTQSGIEFIQLDDIIFAEARGNCSVFILENSKEFVVTKTLKDVQDILEDSHFLRVHRQYVVNLKKVKHFDRVDSVLRMDNKAELPVARLQKDKLLSWFKMI